MTKEQKREANRRDYQKHKAGYIARAKKWQILNPEKAKIQKQKANLKMRATRPSYFAAKTREWREQNKERYTNNRRTYDRNYKPRRRILKAAWRAANPDKVRAQIKRRTLCGKTAEQDHRRRATMLNNGCEDCSSKVKLLRLLPLCHYCFGLIAMPHIDHVIPISRGGEHRCNNLVTACKACNLSKGNKLVSEWIPNELREVA